MSTELLNLLRINEQSGSRRGTSVWVVDTQIPWQQSKPIAFSIPNGHKYRTGDPNSWVQNCSCVLTIYFATVSCGFSQSKAAIASNLRAASFTKKHARTINFLYVLQKQRYL